jgi:uroporphyrinogen-III synthase
LAKSFPKDRPVIHCAGTITRGSITEDLIAAGYDAYKHIYYSQVPVIALPFSCAAEFSHILFHSPMAARTFCALTSGAQNITAISISPETNAELEGMTFRGKHVAAKPNEQHMLAALNA